MSARGVAVVSANARGEQRLGEEGSRTRFCVFPGAVRVLPRDLARALPSSRSCARARTSVPATCPDPARNAASAASVASASSGCAAPELEPNRLPIIDSPRRASTDSAARSSASARASAIPRRPESTEGERLTRAARASGGADDEREAGDARGGNWGARWGGSGVSIARTAKRQHFAEE